MLRKLITFLAIVLVGANPVMSADKFSPYSKREANFLYNLLFCDDPSGFKPDAVQVPAHWQSVLFAKAPNAKHVLELAEDPKAEGRIRALAYNWLRQNGHPVPKHKLLGVIVEVGLDGGLDALAAFSDGGVRYINQSGKLAVVEGGLPATQPIVSKLFAASQTLILAIGPWDKERLPPPPKGNIRLTFLVSDGLYFGQGSIPDMQREALAAPVIDQATQLLSVVVNASAK